MSDEEKKQYKETIHFLSSHTYQASSSGRDRDCGGKKQGDGKRPK